MIKGFLKDMAQYAPAQFVPGIIGLISIPIFTRLFSPEDYGNYVLVIATVAVLVTIVSWLNSAIIRFYPTYNQKDKLDIFIGTVVNLALISIGLLSALYLIAVWAFRDHFTHRLYLPVLIGSLLFMTQGFFAVLQHILRAQRKAKWYTAFILYNSFVSLLLGLIFVVALHRGVEGLLLGSFLGTSFALPFLWHRAIDAPPWKVNFFSKELAFDMAKYGFPLLAGNLAAWVLSLSDRYLLEFMRGSTEVGIYSASYGIAERSIMIICNLFMLASGPISMSVWEKEGLESSRQFTAKVTRYFLIICVPAVIGLSVLAKPILSLITPQEYHEGFKIIPLVAIGAFFLGLQRSYLTGLLFHKKSHLYMICIIIAGILNIILNFLFVPYYGYKAAACTTLISYGSLLIAIIIISRKYFIWQFPFATLWKAISASAIMGIAVYYLYFQLAYSMLLSTILVILLGILIYFFSLCLFQELLPQEKRMLQQIFK